MSLRTILTGAAVVLFPTLAAAHVEVEYLYARVVSPTALSAAVYMSINNHSDEDDVLFRVDTDVAERVEIHANVQDADGVVRMMELENGISIASGAPHHLRPGGEHVMLMGLTGPLEQGDTFEMLLFFDVWIPITVTVTVDNAAVDALANDAEN